MTAKLPKLESPFGDDYYTERHSKFPELLAYVFPRPDGPADTAEAEHFIWNLTDKPLYLLEVTDPEMSSKFKIEAQWHRMCEEEIESGSPPEDTFAFITTNDDANLHELMRQTALALWDPNDWKDDYAKARNMLELIHGWAS